MERCSMLEYIEAMAQMADRYIKAHPEDKAFAEDYRRLRDLIEESLGHDCPAIRTDPMR